MLINTKLFDFPRNGKLLSRKYRIFFLPTILAGVASSMSIIIDSILVGNMLGPNEMASVNLCMPVMQFYYMISVLIGMGASTLIAINLGSRDYDNANKFFNLSIVSICVVSLFLTLVGGLSVNTCTSIIASDDSLRSLVKAYLIPLLWGNFPILLLPAFVYILRTDGFVGLASTVLIVANVVNLILDVVFMGPLHMGILGSSLATVCGYSVGVGLLGVYVISKQRRLRFIPLQKTLMTLYKPVKEILVTGLPAAVGIGLVAVKLFFMNHLVGNIAGSDGLIVFSVCISCLSFMSMFISGTAGTMMPIVGTLYGERDYKGIYFTMRYSFFFSLVVSGIVVALFEIFPNTVFALFGVEGNVEVLKMGAVGLRLFAVSLLGVSVSFLMMYYFLTIRESFFANVISFTEGFLFPIPLALLFSSFMGLEGVWMAYIVTEVLEIATIFFMITYRKRQRKDEHLNALLIKDVSPDVILEASVALDKHTETDFATRLVGGLHELYPDFKQHQLMERVVDGFTSSVRQAIKGDKQVLMDVRILQMDSGIRLLVRNDGELFNPTEQLCADRILSAKRIIYNSVLSLNNTQIDWPSDDSCTKDNSES